MTLRSLVLRYAAFAVLATVVNIGTQRVVLQFGETGDYLALAIAAGTITGLVAKYLLDKRWIFHDGARGLRNHGRQFTIYTAMGIVTTAIFWGTETAFWYIWQTDAMRELGAVIGLGIGYVVKYNLDRRYVFTNRQPGATA